MVRLKMLSVVKIVSFVPSNCGIIDLTKRVSEKMVFLLDPSNSILLILPELI